MNPSNRVCERCAAELSRYNPDSYCSTCARTATAPGVPDHAWRDAAVQRALAAWEFGEVLRLVRKRSGLSQMAVHALTSLPQSFISSLERGQKQIGSPATLLDLLHGLGLPSDLHRLLLTPLQTERSVHGAERRSDAAAPWTRDRMVAALDAAIGGSAMKRRSVLTAVSGAALTQYVLQSALAPAESFAASTGTTTVTDGLIASLQGTTDALRQVDATSGSGSLARTAKSHLRLVLQLLKQGGYDEKHGRRLAAVAADTASQAGWYTFDGGDHDGAQQLFLGALRAAHASHDSRVRAGALAFLAIHAYSSGDPRDAITAARAGRQAIAGRDAPALHAMLLTRQARGHARLRDERHAMAALAESRELCAKGRGEDDPHWLYWINPGEILGQTASCYLELGQPTRAALAFTDARGALSREETRTTAQFLSRAATAHIRAGDADTGYAAADEALGLAEGISSSRLDDHLRTMLNEARPYATNASTHELLQRGEHLLRQRQRAAA